MDPPVPMPNTEVKHLSADDSTLCKNRTLPASFYNNKKQQQYVERIYLLNLFYMRNHVTIQSLKRPIPGGLAQLGEHLPYKQRVGGSSPSSSTI